MFESSNQEFGRSAAALLVVLQSKITSVGHMQPLPLVQSPKLFGARMTKDEKLGYLLSFQETQLQVI